MTTIAANKVCMASDTNVVLGGEDGGSGETFFQGPSKIIRIGDAIVGCAGHTSAINKFLDYYRKQNGSKRKVKKPEFGEKEELVVLMLTPKGLFHCESSIDVDEVKSPYFAIGTGANLALVAMDCGRGPKEAVEAACVRDPDHTKAPVDVLYLKEQK